MIVSVPVWGEWYHRVFAAYVAPALEAALKAGSHTARLIAHTDRPEALAARGFEVRPVPSGESHYRQFGQCHAEALAAASDGEIVVLLNADTVVSRELFTVVRRHLDAGKGLIACAGTRVLENNLLKPGRKAADLAAWGVKEFHPMLYDTVWPARAVTSSCLHFRENGGLVLRAFHLHPLACRKDRALDPGVTIDAGLQDGFAEDEIHVVTDPAEFAMISLTQDDRRFKVHARADIADVRHWAQRAHPRHWWFLKHRIVLAGTGAEGPVERDIMAQLLQGH